MPGRLSGPTARHGDEPAGRPGLVIVDAANVVGSVPDGWWRDRVGATERLRDHLVTVATIGIDADGVPDWARTGPFELVMVVEGAARGVFAVPGVEVIPAAGSGDDAIVDLARRECPHRPCLVVTADRLLRSRVTALGADVVGPHAVRYRSSRR